MTSHTTFVRLRTGLRKRLFVIDTLIGAVLCAVLAGVAIIGGAVVFRASAIPIAFIPVVVLVARRFGFVAGTLGTLFAAIMFATFLLHPMGSVQVATERARSSITWLLLLGIPVSIFFAPTLSELSGRSRQAES